MQYTKSTKFSMQENLANLAKVGQVGQCGRPAHAKDLTFSNGTLLWKGAQILAKVQCVEHRA